MALEGVSGPTPRRRRPLGGGRVGGSSDLVDQIQDALSHLHDLTYLQIHPLARRAAAVADPTKRANPGKALRQSLEGAIEALRPSPNTPGSYHDRRGYEILRLRYLEALDVATVLKELALGRSEYYRDHKRAVQAVAAQLRELWGLVGGETQPSTPVGPSERRSASGVPNNLPLSLTSFVGREREIAEVGSLLGVRRLVTLTGTGGSGKTRLALKVAMSLLEDHPEDYPDGVWVVELDTLADPEVVPQAVASVLGLLEPPGRPIDQTLRRHLASKRLLLLLDNCEHLIVACARLASSLLRSCPGLVILATSRELLEVEGEVGFRVPSLSIPPADGSLLPNALTEYESVKLFAERAVAASPSFRVAAANINAVVQICRRLDGIPLAIELAAARLRVLGIEQIAARLDDRFGLLTGGSRNGLTRHQTLRATVDWSYDLLDERERLLFRRLATFVGGFSLEAAEAVCSEDGIEASQILDLLTHLVDRSLVVVDGTTDGVARYRLLETLRQYGWDRLTESGEVESVQRRHRDWYLALAERAEPQLWTSGQRVWLDRLEAELGNLRAALGWCLERDGEAGLRLAASLWQLWQVRGHATEGRRWLEALLERSPEPTVQRAKALLAAGGLASQQEGDYASAAARLEEGLAIFRAAGDRWGIAWSLLTLDWLSTLTDRPCPRQWLEESLDLFRELGDLWGLGRALFQFVGFAAESRERAKALHEEALTYQRLAGDTVGAALTLNRLGTYYHGEGDHRRARELFEESLDLSREIGNRWGISWALGDLGNLEATEGNNQLARELLEESLTIARELGDEFGLTWRLLHLGILARFEREYGRSKSLLEECLRSARGEPRGLGLASLASLARAEGELRQAEALFRDGLVTLRTADELNSYIPNCVWLWGGLEVERGMHARGVRLISAGAALGLDGSFLCPHDRAELDADLAAARSALGEEAFARTWAEGQAMTLAQAVEYALQWERGV